MTTAKAEATRAAIVAAAMRLFEEKGYDGTTMRAIAAEAGVSTGNAYYYFGSKEELIQGYYDQIASAHRDAVADVLATETTFAGRLSGVLERWIDVAEPSHAFAVNFFRNAADPDSPLSPFSPESVGAREVAIDVHREVIAGADLKLAPNLRAELPELLWMLQMGIVLFWVYDRSPGQARTRTLVRGVVPLVDRMVRLARLPVVRGLSDDIVALVRSLRA